ncbi:MAG: hypothetical protein AB1483_03295 [Candidatus Zixiibacteriota bacterium]
MSLLKPLDQKTIEADPRYARADEFMRSFEPLDNRSYEWVYEYAIRTFEMADRSLDTLDAKAESMVRYLGPGSGILGVGLASLAASEISVRKPELVIVAFGVMCILAAILAAFRALLPHPHTFGASVQDATKVAGHYDDRDKCLGYCAAGLGVSIAVLRIVSEKKAQQLRWCHGLFFAGIAAFLIAGAWAIASRVWC